jgi:hypothetical protein
MKHKVKKFGRGGDILTALGAGLAGYGAYKYFTKDKDKDDDYTRRVKEFGRKGDFPEAQKEEKAEAKVADDRDEARDAARERALRQSKGRPEMGGGDKSVMESDATATRASTPTDKKPAGPTTRGLYRPLATSDDKPAAPKLKPGESKTMGKGALKSYPNKDKPNDERPSKPYPEKEAANVLGERNLKPFPEKKATPTTTKTTKPTEAAATKAKPTEATKKKKDSESGMGPKNTFLTKERQEKARKAYFGKKDGGAVKKYADGGTTSSKPAPKKAPMPAFAREAKENRERDQRVKKEREEFDKGAPTRLKDQGSFKKGGMTASKRADGIAIRGKTRA